MKYTLKQFQKEFKTDDDCLDTIMAIRYRDNTCPKCHKKTKFHRITGRKQYACQYCGHHVAPCAGTVFEKSRTPLTDWFYAMYLFTSTRHGVPAKELERQLGVTYKTAWRMAHKLRELMQSSDDHSPLEGHVEMDESYFGGKYRGKRRKGYHAGHPKNYKTSVFGMVQRDGLVKTGIVQETNRVVLQPHIDRHVLWGTTISTDEAGAYMHLGGLSYEHGVVRHKREQYKNDIYHTNTIEGYWSRLKNSIRGTHIHVSKKYLNRYLAEFAYRYNHRKECNATIFYRLLAGLAKPYQAA